MHCRKSKDGLEWSIGDIISSVNNQPVPLELPPFDYSAGPSARTKELSSPFEIFQLMFTTEIAEAIVQQSKRFASQKGVTLNFCTEELLAFIGMNVAMGMLRLPQVRDYWTTHEVLSTPWFPTIMRRDRFFTLLRFLHLADSSKQKKKGEQGYDPLYKVRPIVDHLPAVFSKHYHPSRHLSVDEMMIGTRCRLSFLQYMPKKPTRFGIKVWVIAEAKTGYVLDFSVYTGATDDKKTTNLGQKVVLKLMEQYRGKGHCLFIDNFYTSPSLLLALLDQGTYCTGTVRIIRKGFPKQLIPDKTYPTGTFRYAVCKQKNQLIGVWWRDRKDVFVLTTMHNKSAAAVMKRPKGEREKKETPCPTAIIDYNNYMGGVDLADQMLSYYSMTSRRMLKWWKKVFWRMIDLCIMNSWIIFHTNTPNSSIKTQRLFRLELVQQLVQPLIDLRSSLHCPEYLQDKKGRKRGSSEPRLVGKHFAYKEEKRGRCVICTRASPKKKNAKTHNYCPKCQVYLCFGQCFETYHTKASV